MKLTNGDVFLCKEALQHLTDRDDIPIKYSMPIVRMAKKLNEEHVLIDQKRNRLIQKYGETKEGQVSIKPDNPNWDKFVQEFTELMNLETEVNITPAKIPETIIIPNKDLMFLEPFLEVVE